MWLGILLETIDEESAKRIVVMEYRTFIHQVIMIPAQILHTARRLVFRLLAVNRWTDFLIHAPPALKKISLA